MVMRNKFQPIAVFCLLVMIAITGTIVLISCKQSQKCGLENFNSNKSEFYICEDMLKEDTLDPQDDRWFRSSDVDGNSWLGYSDAVHFNLPANYKIIKVEQSFKLVPSIWARSEDDVTQLIKLPELQKYGVFPKEIKLIDNVLNEPLQINEKVAREMYFKVKARIEKKELLNSMQKLFESYETEIKGITNDSSTTLADKLKMIKDNRRERNIYLNYLKNYSTWNNASSDQFSILDVQGYLTLTIQNEKNKFKLTLINTPVHGN